MVEITAAAVKALRDSTGLPMMECKQALVESGGDQEAAIKSLREKGKKTMASRADRGTDFGRMGIYTDLEKGVGAMVELRCESAPVVGNEDFVRLATDVAKQLATGPGAATPEELLKQPSPSNPKQTLGDQKDDLSNRIREVFNIGRMKRVLAPAGAYAHHTGEYGVLVELAGTSGKPIDPAVAKDIAMHIAAKNPKAVSKEDLDPELVNKEREILSEAARKEGKPDNIIAKMVEGRLRNFFAEMVLAEQPFIKDEAKTVGALAKENGVTVKQFVYWRLGKE